MVDGAPTSESEAEVLGRAKPATIGHRGARPTRAQYAITREVTRWYLDSYYTTKEDIGTAQMFCDPARVGAFAVPPEALRAGDPDALFGVLVMSSMFQRRQDAQILRILRGLPSAEAEELTSLDRLVALAGGSPCDGLASSQALIETCNLAKDRQTRLGTCAYNPALTSCHLKRHTVQLKRYGHFGKVPTSIALTVREAAQGDLNDLRTSVLEANASPAARAKALLAALCRAWRVSDKISAMFLSAVCNPDLSPGMAPWAAGIDWTQFVVIDSNVDLFLRSIRYPGPWTYEARRQFICRLARRVRLDDLRTGLSRFNPRLVQQAAYLFMSETNRRLVARDCGSVERARCPACPDALRERCPRRRPERETNARSRPRKSSPRPKMSPGQ